MFDKFFGRSNKKQESTPDISFGRYSDNNKSVSKVSRWAEADNLFKEKKYPESIDAFFDYLRDDEANNVIYERNGAEGRFEVYQGSKIVRGSFDGETLRAEVALARMAQPNVPVMRRLLEMNYTLYYSRCALDSDRLSMRFDSDLEASNPSKLYYGLKELATKADKQDDLLVKDFAALEMIDNDHLSELPLQEKEVKYQYLQTWIKETLDTIGALDAEKFAGGISYLLLGLIYRIDYLIKPEALLLNDLERIVGIYFKKDERTPFEKNKDMIEEYKKIQAKTKEEIFTSLFRSRHTFSIVMPQNQKAVADAIQSANQDMTWYRDNKYPALASRLIEYGFSYCQYSYSLPKVITDFFQLFMRVNYGSYFLALGYTESLYDPFKNEFNMPLITEAITAIESRWKEKYPNMDFKVQNLRFDSLVNFNHTFTTEIQSLNMEGNKIN
jgi:hypothetical protein